MVTLKNERDTTGEDREIERKGKEERLNKRINPIQRLNCLNFDKSDRERDRDRDNEQDKELERTGEDRDEERKRGYKETYIHSIPKLLKL